MPTFSKRILENLATCHEDLQKIAHEAIKYQDFSVICGHRTIDEQNRAFREGNSKLQWPFSKHNTYPSLAFDIAPWPINWNDLRQFLRLSGTIKRASSSLGIEIVWGGDWKMVDMPHYELVKR
jgi:peptidoglycan L-alanyl-D-glutamate endopeptidase CwlK